MQLGICFSVMMHEYLVNKSFEVIAWLWLDKMLHAYPFLKCYLLQCKGFESVSGSLDQCSLLKRKLRKDGLFSYCWHAITDN